MLFNSYPFIFLFLPLSLWLFFRLGRTSHRNAAIWLALVSLFFYAWWNPPYVGLLLLSIVFNYTIGLTLTRSSTHPAATRRKWLMLSGVGANLALLGYYKYSGFLQSITADFPGLEQSIMLPLGISFFTFTQIAFLVDAYRGQAREASFAHYTLFVSYFPHLIAGPILHHKEMMPQFGEARTYRFSHENIAIGLTIFAIGLFKKTVLADGIAPYATPLFTAAGQGTAVTLLDAWGGTLAYTLQLYFDFSGYSDMAIGLSRMFGIRLPLNFHSPYKAANIIEFWRRWHITLSRFLRDYLYIPLGGNRKGKARRYLNLMLTMLLGGLWHGAGWTFIVWGGLHGLYLVINHAWRGARSVMGWGQPHLSGWRHAFSVGLTFIAVAVAWVCFRSPTLDAAWVILQGMMGLNGVALPASWQGKLGSLGQWLAAQGVVFGNTGIFRGKVELFWIAVLLAIVWTLPNTQQFMARFKPVLQAFTPHPPATAQRLQWQPGWRWAIMAGLILAAALLNISQTSEFLYFQF